MTYAEDRYNTTTNPTTQSENPTVNQEPVTKEEATMFMSRLTTTLVGYSEQAKTIEKLQTQINELNTRVASVLSETDNLRREIYQVTAERTQAQREARENLELAQTYERERNDVRTRLTDTTERLADANTNLADARRTISEQTSTIETVTAQRDVAQRDLEYWRERAQRAEKNAVETGNQLTTANEKLGKLQTAFDGVFKSVQALTPMSEDTAEAFGYDQPVEKPQF